MHQNAFQYNMGYIYRQFDIKNQSRSDILTYSLKNHWTSVLFCRIFAYLFYDNMSKSTIVLGASPNPSRYSYLATLRLQESGHEVFPIGIRDGAIGDERLITDRDFSKNVDTVSLYIGAQNQPEWYPLIFRCNPKRIIMNPGTENPELLQMAKQKGIECIAGCTLVMLATGEF